MIIGITFIIAGILIAMFPKLLSIIVAAFLIVVGVVVTSISYSFKTKSKRHAVDNPFMDFFRKY